jgi:hypothetical protein
MEGINWQWGKYNPNYKREKLFGIAILHAGQFTLLIN